MFNIVTGWRYCISGTCFDLDGLYRRGTWWYWTCDKRRLWSIAGCMLKHLTFEIFKKKLSQNSSRKIWMTSHKMLQEGDILCKISGKIYKWKRVLKKNLIFSFFSVEILNAYFRYIYVPLLKVKVKLKFQYIEITELLLPLYHWKSRFQFVFFIEWFRKFSGERKDSSYFQPSMRLVWSQESLVINLYSLKWPSVRLSSSYIFCKNCYCFKLMFG